MERKSSTIDIDDDDDDSEDDMENGINGMIDSRKSFAFPAFFNHILFTDSTDDPEHESSANGASSIDEDQENRSMNGESFEKKRRIDKLTD